MANEALTGLTPEDMNILKAISLGGGVSFDMPEKKTGYTFADIEGLDAQPARSRSNHIFGMAKDVFDYMSGLDPNAYVGKTAKMTNEYMKTLAEDDPEGKMIDMNRAKVLSQRASETEDIALKKRYGAEIKKLLPRETQGLDDLTASAFLVGDSERLRQQLLKNAGNLAVQQAKNAKDITTTGMKTESNENIANTRAEALRDVANIRGQYDLSKKDKDYLREQLKQEGMSDRQADKLVADYERELMKQEHADYRTVYGQDAATERTNIAQGGANYRANLNADTRLKQTEANNKRAIEVANINANARVTSAASKKGQMTDDQAREKWPSIEAKFNSDQASLQEGLDLLEKYNLFGPVVGRQRKLGIGSTEELEAFGAVKQKLTKAVQARLEQVREAAGTGRAADSEKEGERVIGLLSGDPTIPQAAIVGAVKEFMRQTESTMHSRKQELFRNNNVPASGNVTIKSIKRIK